MAAERAGPVIGRRRRSAGLWVLAGALAAGLCAVAVAATLMAILGANVACLGGGGGGSVAGSPPTVAAVKAIPAERLRIYREAGQRYDVDWAFLASIGYQECGHGACAHVYPSGCGGPMQIAIERESACSPGPGPTIWERYKVDADGGGADPFDPADAVFTAARMLRPVFGLAGDSYAAYRQVACNYYGACADSLVSYADEVMSRAAEYGFHGKGSPAAPPAGTEPAPAGGSACVASTGGTSGGEIVRIAESQLGRAEGPLGSNCNPYGPCEQWCALFVAWVWERAGVPMRGGTAPYAYSGSIYEWAKAHEGGLFATPAPGDPPFSAPTANGARVLAPTATPAPGDAVLYGSGPQASDHVGIVERVFPNGEITTIDGNYGDRVARVGPFPPAQATANGEPAPIFGYAHPPSGESEVGHGD
ncbi:MAG: CHAP domain-containing protein [Solirubrobacterales bacterium]